MFFFTTISKRHCATHWREQRGMTLIENCKLANQIARLAAIVAKKLLAIIEFGFRRVWRILRISEGVIYRDLQNSSYPTKAKFNNCFIIHSKYSPVLKGVLPFRFCFFCSLKITQPRSQNFLGQGFNNLQRAAFLTSFWLHWFNMTKFFPNLVNINWLWQIIRVFLTNQKRGNILNDIIIFHERVWIFNNYSKSARWIWGGK